MVFISVNYPCKVNSGHMNEFQENIISGVRVGDFVQFVFSRGFVVFELLGLFGGCVCGLGLTTGRVQGVLANDF